MGNSSSEAPRSLKQGYIGPPPASKNIKIAQKAYFIPEKKAPYDPPPVAKKPKVQPANILPIKSPISLKPPNPKASCPTCNSQYNISNKLPIAICKSKHEICLQCLPSIFYDKLMCPYPNCRQLLQSYFSSAQKCSNCSLKFHLPEKYPIQVCKRKQHTVCRGCVSQIDIKNNLCPFCLHAEEKNILNKPILNDKKKEEKIPKQHAKKIIPIQQCVFCYELFNATHRRPFKMCNNRHYACGVCVEVYKAENVDVCFECGQKALYSAVPEKQLPNYILIQKDQKIPFQKPQIQIPKKRDQKPMIQHLFAQKKIAAKVELKKIEEKPVIIPQKKLRDKKAEQKPAKIQIKPPQKKENKESFSAIFSSHTECQICSLPFNPTNKAPMMLCPNQHNACQPCANLLVEKNKECPFCRVPLLNPIAKNRILLDLLELNKKAKMNL